MTKEALFNTFINDSLFIEKGYIKEGQLEKIKFADVSTSKIIDVLKIIINGKDDDESDLIISNKINKYLNK